jgi:UDP-glucose 4-epimerase
MEKCKILITGKGSYIGTSFVEWLEQWPEVYEVVEISVRGEEWKTHDFSQYDVVLHVAGIAHVSTDPKMEEQYYKVNRDLTIDVASKAKKENVKQFIFISSIIVYGDSSSYKKIIDRNTLPNPTNFYGDSKLQAEYRLKAIESNDFKIAILRPPMIYGKGSKGNYSKLVQVARKSLVFPDIDNERSMIHIENLCEFIRMMINNEETGIFFPQNREYVKTSEMVKLVAEVYNRKILTIKTFNPILNLMINRFQIINKVFGNLVYDQTMSAYADQTYCINDLKSSIRKSEV